MNHELAGLCATAAAAIAAAITPQQTLAHDGASYCDIPAELFLIQASEWVGSVEIEVGGPLGTLSLSFASGSVQTDIMAAINALTESTGVGASPADDSPRMMLRSMLAGDDAFVSVTQLSGEEPIVVDAPLRGEPAFAMTAHGQDAVPGDANCDRAVDVDDVLVVVRNWGECPADPPCLGDVNGDQRVNVEDLLAVIQNFGAAG